MNLLDLYNLLQQGKVTEQQVATSLGISVKNWRIRATKFGHRLPLVLSVLDKINNDAITRDEASKALSTTVRGVNLLMKSWGVARPIKESVVQRAAAKVKWEVRKKFAIDYIGSAEDLISVSEKAGVSDRQMRRWVSDLLKKHYDMPFKDLKHVSMPRRAMLAKDIEEAEGLELAKQKMLRAVFTGQKSVSEEAYDRIAAHRGRKLQRVRGK